VEIKYTYTLQEFYHADGTFIRQSWYGWLLLILVLATTSYGLYTIIAYGVCATTIFNLLAAPVVLVIGVISRRILLRRLMNDSPGYAEEHTTTLDDSGLHVEMKSASFRLSWNTICKVIKSRTVFIVLHSPVHYFLIPKRAFSGIEEIERARSLFKNAAARYVMAV